MKRALFVLVLAGGLIALASCQQKQTTRGRTTGTYNQYSTQGQPSNLQTFVADLTAAPGVQTSASGTGTFNWSQDQRTLQFKLDTRDIQDVTAAHIHLGQGTAEGPPIATLYSGAPKSGSGTVAQGTLSSSNLMGPMAGKDIPDLVREINNGNTYVNVHTTKNPQGEIRGPIHATTTGGTSDTGGTGASGMSGGDIGGGSNTAGGIGAGTSGGTSSDVTPTPPAGGENAAPGGANTGG